MEYEFARMVVEDRNNEAQSYRYICQHMSLGDTAEAGSKERKKVIMEIGGIVQESPCALLIKMK